MKQSRHPMYRRLGVPQGRSEREHKISSPTGTAHATINIYSLLLHISAPTRLLYDSRLQGNTFIINAVQMCIFAVITQCYLKHCQSV